VTASLSAGGNRLPIIAKNSSYGKKTADIVILDQQKENRLTTKTTLRRLDGIDLLRGLAILFVLLNHVNMRLRIARIPYTNGIPDALVTLLVWNGQRAVQTFFAISGFLITATALRRWGAPGSVPPGEFYRLRIARIVPLLLALLAVLSALHFLQVKNFVVQPKTGGIGRALLAALTFRINVLEATRGYLPANWDILWSLSVEEVFYLCFPLACRFFGRTRALVVLLIALVVMGPFALVILARGNEVWREYSYLGGMDAIALGCLTGLIVHHRKSLERWSRGLAVAGAALLIFSFCFTRTAKEWGLTRSGLDMTVVALGACMIAAASAQSHWTAPRALAPLLSLGRRSYEVYLTHMFVVFALFELYLNTGKKPWGVPILFATSILVAAFLGDIVARVYSEPMNQRLRKSENHA